VVILRRTKIIPVRLVQNNTDTDWDGVPDKKDCQPLNPRKHQNETMQTPLPGYQTAQQAPPGYQYAQQFQIPSRMYDESIINLPSAKFKFIRFL